MRWELDLVRLGLFRRKTPAGLGSVDLIQKGSWDRLPACQLGELCKIGN